MKRNLLLLGFAMAVICAIPAMASEPGQPLDCGDWVFLEPGLSCSAKIQYPCSFGDLREGGFTNPLCRSTGSEKIVDNVGNLYRLLFVPAANDDGSPVLCAGTQLHETRLLRFDGTNEAKVAHLTERCVSENPLQIDVALPNGVNPSLEYWSPALIFDDKAGSILFSMRLMCGPPGAVNAGMCEASYGEMFSGYSLMSIDGLATTFEVLQTYTPTTNEITFRVPYMPEGFQYADWFDTYYGSLASVGDSSQAHPLQCGYPATAPSVGDYLTVEDTLPPLESGHGRYYVTATTYMGQTRYGRRSSGGVLTGRDPSVLPACVE